MPEFVIISGWALIGLITFNVVSVGIHFYLWGKIDKHLQGHK
jgi:hypothetical protein